MTKLPLTQEIRNSSCSIPHIKIDSSYDNLSDCEANLLVKSESCFNLDNAIINQDSKGDHSIPLPAIISSRGTDSLSIEEYTIVEAKLEPIPIKIIDKSSNVPHRSVEDHVEEPKRAFEVYEEKKIKKQSSPPLWGSTSICGRRSEMEDSVVALPRFLRIPSQMLSGDSIHQFSTAHVFGVYDGHGGCQVANYCREHLHSTLAKEIEIAKESLLHIEIGEHNWKEQWIKIFLNCFQKLDDQVGGFNACDVAPRPPLPAVAPESVGSTAVVAIVCSTHIIVANCGDSRAVLNRGKVPTPLSLDHKPNRDDECARIEAAGGKVINWDGYRVSGVLAVSRSIGDRYLRPYVIADPEIMFVPRVKEDECLILASDGLWDVMTNEEACDLARRRILIWHKKNGATAITTKEKGEDSDPAAQDAADYLSQLAFQRGSRDNISVIVVDLKAQRKFKKKT
ncbi:hypothetical protein RD792_010874 [Penstemon davidsonii]|uniref:protein-serine/threonine phosphatase n=1 Tax=Penstemon davidsonii TaxID=160366 RepID=A0ABR0D4F5_9LAMI|nr:hypothetical protein RD792_010874 [Penstemon davidsonii]